MTMEEVDLGRLLPEMVLLAGVVGCLLLALWTPRARQGRVRALGLGVLVVALVASVADAGRGDTALYDGTWQVDGVTTAVRLAVLLGTALALAASAGTFAGHPREAEVTVLALLSALGAVALGASGDLLTLAASYLLASVPLYALVGFAKDAAGVEAALKQYLVGAFCGVLMLVGVAALVLAAGTTRYDALAVGLADAPGPLVAAGVLGVLVGVAFKAGAVPAHFWVPDAVAGTTAPVAALVTTVPKVGAVAAAWRLLDVPFAAAPAGAVAVVAALAAASMTLGNLAAFWQDDPQRLLAYSSISQVGYLLVIAGTAGRSDLGLPALTVYLVGYAVTNTGAFAVLAAFPARRRLTDWAGTGARHPGLVLALVVLLLGLVGTPPTVVFVGKLGMFAAAADADLLWLAVLAAVNTVASVFYYLRWVGAALAAAPRGGPDSAAAAAHAPPLRAGAVVATAAAVLGVLAGVGAAVLA